MSSWNIFHLSEIGESLEMPRDFVPQLLSKLVKSSNDLSDRRRQPVAELEDLSEIGYSSRWLRAGENIVWRLQLLASCDNICG
jgi:hypothetical protein